MGKPDTAITSQRWTLTEVPCFCLKRGRAGTWTPQNKRIQGHANDLAHGWYPAHSMAAVTEMVTPNCLISAQFGLNVGSTHQDQRDSGNKKQGRLGEQVRVHSEPM